MPKIKFSALVSGMSGKAQGSVFATNNGGAYFRNNTSKVKTKNALNAKRKSLFSEVAGLWRNLTSEQQNAWRGAVSNFVVQNSFGDNRTPTGFEVFTRVNNVRFEQGLTLLTDPPTPRALPSLNDLEMETPDLFLYMPTRGILNFNRFQPDEAQNFTSDNLFLGSALFGAQFIVGQYNFSGFKQNIQFLDLDKGLFQIPLVGGGNVACVVKGATSTIQNILLTIESGAGVIQVETTSEPIDLSKPFTLGVYMGNTDENGIEIWVNGELVSVSVNVSGTFTAQPPLGSISVFHESSATAIKTSCADFRYYTVSTNTLTRGQITRGYLIGTETTIFQMSDLDNGGTINNYNTLEGGNLQSHVSGPAQAFLMNFPQNRVPVIILTTTSVGDSGMAVYIYATPCISFGRVTSTPNKKLLGILSYEGEQSWTVDSLWLQKYGSFSPNGYIQFFLQVSDTTTGINNASQVKPPKRTRFKAGAELSGAVN